ncbi:MAG: sensor histidine kinase [Myxococcales bacterium]|nr:sensor histidine kinase [Myxococcales bacterium]
MHPLLRIEHLEPWPDVTPEDETAFTHYARELTVGYALRATLVLVVCVLLWWPIDLLVAPDSRYSHVFSGLRVGFLSIQAAAFVAFVASATVRTHALVAAVFTYGLTMGFLGYALGHLGGPELPWFADTFIGLLPIALIPLSLRARVTALIVVSSSLLAGHFLPFPDHFESAYAGGQASFVVFTAVVSVVVGELIHRTVRRSFFQGRSVARAREALAKANDALTGVNQDLARRVSERTDELRRLASHLDDALEQERARTSRELHDELGQEVTALRYSLDLAMTRYDDAPDGIAPLLARLDKQVERTAAATRGLVTALRPQLLETLGLAGAIAAVLTRVEGAGIAATLALTPADLLREPRSTELLPPGLDHVLFRVIQEACTNVLRHSAASRVELQLRADSTGVELIMDDDGVGLPAEHNRVGFGLLGMRERVQAAGGELTFGASRPANPERPGLRLVATFPAPNVVPTLA